MAASNYGAAMESSLIKDLTIFITKEGGRLVTDSRAVAIEFDKDHKNILRDIRKMRDSDHPEIAEHYRLNFEPAEYIDGKGERRPMYRMTAEGLSELAMGFSGVKARLVRIRFIAAFREVAGRLEARERSITEQLHELARREAPSEAKGKIGSRLMNERRREKPEFMEQRRMLENLAQPKLWN